MITVAVHQPELFPILSYLRKLALCDKFVLLDSVAFSRDSLQQRTWIKGPQGTFHLTIPYRHKGRPQHLDEVEIDGTGWTRRHLKSLTTSYGKTAGFLELRPALERFFAVDTTRLLSVTIASVLFLAEHLGYADKLVFASDLLGVSGAKGELVLSICQAMKADVYLSGVTGSTYLDRSRFAAAGIAVATVPSTPPPEYRQRWGEFEPVISGLDLLCNLGVDGAKTYMEGLR